MGAIRDRLWSKAGQQRIPLSGAFELLPVCNLKCKMCYVRKSMAEVNAAGGLQPTEFWLDCAKQAKEKGMLFPLLTGGEPFLRNDFQEILMGMKKLGMMVSVNSNGTLIDESMAAWLGKCLPIRINLTLYGASEETYERLCGNADAYARVRRAVEWLKKYEVPLKFNASITPENVGELEEMISFAKSVDSPIEIATYMFPPVRRDAETFGQNHRLSPEEAGLARVKADWLRYEPNIFRLKAKSYSHFVPITPELLKQQENREQMEMSCRAGRCTFWVDWQGNMGTCGLYLASQYSLKEMSLADAWEKVVQEINTVRYSPVCTNCPNFNLCHPCIAVVHSESGSVDGCPEYMCKMNAAAAKYYQEYAARLPKE